METKLNLRLKKSTGKTFIGVKIYQEDKALLDEILSDTGIKLADLLRSLINDVIDGNIKVVL